jgi:large subunit ribosomal protein L30
MAYAVVRVRGTETLTPAKEKTLESLSLTKPNHCVLIEANETTKGMLQAVKDYITWGEVSSDVAQKLSKVSSAKKIGAHKTLIRLNPPAKGFARKGIKLGFKQGGALGYRGDKINVLLERMLQGTAKSSAPVAQKK